jgi:hypothetical protein
MLRLAMGDGAWANGNRQSAMADVQWAIGNGGWPIATFAMNGPGGIVSL